MSSFKIKLINFYPPYIGAGIRLKKINPDYNDLLVSMNLRWYNKNIWGVHFGGSLYSMCDPWFMFIVQRYLGTDYVVWDKAATIRFKKPGTDKVSARFHLSKHTLEIIKAQVDQAKTTDFHFQTQVLSEAGEVIAEVDKTVYANSKEAHKARQAMHRAKKQSNN